MAVILHVVPLAGVCRKGRSSPIPQVRARPEEMRCVGSKRTRELGRDMLLAASIEIWKVLLIHFEFFPMIPLRKCIPSTRTTRGLGPNSGACAYMLVPAAAGRGG